MEKSKAETFLIFVIAVCLLTWAVIHVHSYVRELREIKSHSRPYVHQITHVP